MRIFPVPVSGSEVNEVESIESTMQISEPIYESLPSVTKLVEEQEDKQTTNDFQEPLDIATDFEPNLDLEKDHLSSKIQSLSSISSEEISAPSDENVSIPKNLQPTATMTWYQFLVILLIFCLILLALNILWNNLFYTIIICCITLPILRYFGKV